MASGEGCFGAMIIAVYVFRFSKPVEEVVE
jgi:hypothetical protein